MRERGLFILPPALVNATDLENLDQVSLLGKKTLKKFDRNLAKISSGG